VKVIYGYWHSLSRLGISIWRIFLKKFVLNPYFVFLVPYGTMFYIDRDQLVPVVERQRFEPGEKG
jgi:hypothetical protein